MYAKTYAFLFIGLIATSPSWADVAAVHPPVQAGEAERISALAVLTTLLLCGLMGLVGQGCRVIVGFTTVATSKAVAPADNKDVFNLSRLIFSLIVGFLAGFVTALVQWKQGLPIQNIDVADFNKMFEFAIAGYIGTDIVEAFTVQYFEKRNKEQQEPGVIDRPQDPSLTATENSAQRRIDAAPSGSEGNEPQFAALVGTLSDVHSMMAAVADRVGDTTSPTSIFKQKAPQVMAELIDDFDLENFQAAGILGNIGVECNGFTQLQELHPARGVGGYGWAQWTGERRRLYFAWCENNSLDNASDRANYGFMKHELSTSFSRVITNLKKTMDLASATSVVLDRYEIAGVPAEARRITWAKIALAAFEGENV